MVVGVGVIGTGDIGADHARRLQRSVKGAEVRALFDLDVARMRSVATDLGASAMSSAREVIERDDVDAVVVATIGATHAELTLACIAAGKHVLCEKPLAPTSTECLGILRAETAHGRRLVQVGFMRRYDPAYQVVRRALTDGTLGEPLLIHCVHRNVSTPSSYTSDMSITDTAIHEIDVGRWLTGEEYVSVEVVKVKRSPLVATDLDDPLLVMLRTASGVLVDVEVFANCGYGYDVRCEAVGSNGAISIEQPSTGAVLRHTGAAGPVCRSWKERFSAAYLEELQDWIGAVAVGEVRGPNAWDGYVATEVAQSCLRASSSGTAVEVSLVERPGLYA